MVLIGMPVKAKYTRYKGTKGYPRVVYKEGIVVGRNKNFVVVQFPLGYKECFKESDLIF